MTSFAPGSRLRLAALGLAVAVLVALVALASRSSSLAGGDGPANAGPVIAIIHVVEIVGLALELLIILLLVVIFLTGRRRPKGEEEEQTYYEPPQIPWFVKLFIVAFPSLLVAGFFFALYRFLTMDQPLEPMLVGMPPTAPPGRDGFVEQVTANLGLDWWEVAIAVILAAAAFIAIIRVFREPADGPGVELEEPRPEDALATAVQGGLRDARREPDPRRAVIAAYATMEQILAAQGFPRRAVEAPLEYLARLFGELERGGEPMRTLTDLFELARFSDHEITPATKEEAISALVVIEQELQLAR